MRVSKEKFDLHMGVKLHPNTNEILLYKRAEKYIRTILWIPGVEMIAVVNSLSMYATHEDSDIDLFVVTERRMIWFVRLCMTIQFFFQGVWRHGEAIRGNFCLSFFVTTEALDMHDITIENDIYLYYWVYYLKPVYDRDHVYDDFLRANAWVEIPETQKSENRKFLIGDIGKKSYSRIFLFILRRLNGLIRFFLLPYTLRSWEKLGKPNGVIISDRMLKFHDQDRRRNIRDGILENNFDK